MKKAIVVLAVAFVAIVSLSSCKDQKKCWSIKSTQAGLTEVKYFWGSEDEAITEIKRMEQEESRTNVTKTEEKSYKTSTDCLDKNPKEP